MDIDINEHLTMLKASLKEKFGSGFQELQAKYVEAALNRSTALLEQELSSTKEKVEERLESLQEALQPWKNSTVEIREYLSGSEVWPGNKNNIGAITSEYPEDLRLLVDRSSQICTTIYHNAFNPDNPGSQRAEIKRLCGPAVNIAYQREIRVASNDVVGSTLREVSHRLSQIKVDRKDTETDPDFQRSQSINDAYERNRARRQKIGPAHYLTLSPTDSSGNLKQHTFETLPRQARKELDGFLLDVSLGQGGQRGTDELEGIRGDRDKLVVAFASYVVRNTDISKLFSDQFNDIKDTAKVACKISEDDVLTLYRNHISNVEALFEDLQSKALDELSKIFSNRNARTVNDIRKTNFFQDIEHLKNSLIITTREEWLEIRASLMEELQRTGSLNEEQGHSATAKEIENTGQAFFDTVPDTINRWIAERISETARILLTNYEKAVIEYETAFTIIIESLDKDSILSRIKSEANSETEARYASVEKYVKGSVGHLRSKLIFLFRDIVLEVVILQWRTFGILTKAELLYYLLKLELQQAKDRGVTSDHLSNNRQKLSAMSELVSLGCAARVINYLGETIFFADDLLEHLDDMALIGMGDGVARSVGFQTPIEGVEQRPSLTDTTNEDRF